MQDHAPALAPDLKSRSFASAVGLKTQRPFSSMVKEVVWLAHEHFPVAG